MILYSGHLLVSMLAWRLVCYIFDWQNTNKRLTARSLSLSIMMLVSVRHFVILLRLLCPQIFLLAAIGSYRKRIRTTLADQGLITAHPAVLVDGVRRLD